MTGFSSEWLALREPADARARDSYLTTQLAQWARRQQPVRFIDLACGTGANVRYLAPRMSGKQRWLLVDSDRALLESVRPVQGCETSLQRLDLASGLHALHVTPEVIVTASALLDLVSESWLARLVGLCRASGCAALFALSYDGRIELTPEDPDDAWIRELVNLHQHGDKGFGPALGPDAGRRTGELFRDAGYRVFSAQSDWNLLPTEQRLQQSLLEGWAGAAMELKQNEAPRCRQWLARRLGHVERGASRVRVGHLDVLALP